MSKFRTMLFSVIGIGVLFTMSSAIANAQIPNPPQRDVDAARREGPCHDPWITLAIESCYSRRPNGVGDYNECSPALYAKGNWSSYDELYRAIVQTLNSLSSQSVTFRMDQAGSNAVKLSIDVNGTSIGSGTVGVVAQGGGNVVAQGGGNLLGSDGAGVVGRNGTAVVAQGGGKVVGTGGSSLVNTNGSNFVIDARTYQTLSAACKKIPISGGSYFVVRNCR